LREGDLPLKYGFWEGGGWGEAGGLVGTEGNEFTRDDTKSFSGTWGKLAGGAEGGSW